MGWGGVGVGMVGVDSEGVVGIVGCVWKSIPGFGLCVEGDDIEVGTTSLSDAQCVHFVNPDSKNMVMTWESFNKLAHCNLLCYY